MQQFLTELLQNLRETSLLEIIAVLSGILSVWFSKKENILVYPVGLVNTIIYVYLSLKAHLIGEAEVNFYYTVMSIYGWVIWAKKDELKEQFVHIGFSDKKALKQQLIFFFVCFAVMYVQLKLLREHFYPGVIAAADGFASATAFTAMWLMARKKVESWYWWIGTNIASIPLYYVKGLAFTSVYYFILLVLAIFGLKEWERKANTHKNENQILFRK
jgi:nicotinamide mononucleotide transporter